MAKVRILVVEDDPLHAEKMEIILEDLNYELIAIVDNEEETLQLFRATRPDLLLLDIDLGEEANGIDIAAQINKISPTPIIFTTSFKDKITIDRAKTTKPYAYLIKPIERAALQAAIELALYKFEQDLFQEEVTSDYFAGWKQDLIIKDSFFLKSGNSIEKVAYQDVLWVEVAEEKYLNIMTEKRAYRLRSSLKELSKKLSPQHFVRVHRAYIVNANHIKAINEYDSSLYLSHDQEIPLGKNYKTALINRLNLLN